MSASKVTSIAISQPTPSFLRLVEEAARDCYDETISAKEMPVTKLVFTSSCADVQKEFRRRYQEKVGLKFCNSLGSPH